MGKFLTFSQRSPTRVDAEVAHFLLEPRALALSNATSSPTSSKGNVSSLSRLKSIRSRRRGPARETPPSSSLSSSPGIFMGGFSLLAFFSFCFPPAPSFFAVSFLTPPPSCVEALPTTPAAAGAPTGVPFKTYDK